ncbi:MAG: hypothetical protein KDA44_15900, partial [Planctomycetales bacterium]|nr:hypothetical protein [Planctomycetales bacterium]
LATGVVAAGPDAIGSAPSGASGDGYAPGVGELVAGGAGSRGGDSPSGAAGTGMLADGTATGGGATTGGGQAGGGSDGSSAQQNASGQQGAGSQDSGDQGTGAQCGLAAAGGSASGGDAQAASGSASGGSAGSSAMGSTDAQPGASGGPSGASLTLTKPQDQGAAGPSLAETRGRDWALNLASQNAAPITRPVQVVIRTDSIDVLPTRTMDPMNATGVAEVRLDQPTEAAVDELVSALRDQIKSWGLAGQGLYWKPVLVLSVAPGAERNAQKLTRLLQGSGIDVRLPQTAQGAATEVPRATTR